MNGYSWVSVISIFCYLFLLLPFVTSKKKERVLRSFAVLLVIMILWTGGSFGMRIQLWPSVYFWHHVSLLGILMLPFGYLQFLLDFLGDHKNHGQKFWLVFYLLAFVFNCITGKFIPLPQVVMENGQVSFLYHYSWHIYILFGFIFITVAQHVFIVWRQCRGNRLAFIQLLPLMGGFIAILLGNILTTLPSFVGLPVDMISGVINAVFMFYALYKKKLFRMTILLSKSNYSIIAMVLGVVIFSDLALAIQRFLVQTLGLTYTTSLIIIAVFFLGMIAGLYFIINVSFDAIFTRKEKKQKAALARFSEEITHMLSVSDILRTMADTIEDILEASRVTVLIGGADGNYRIEHTLKPLEEKNFYFRSDNPLIAYLKAERKCVLYQDFSRKTIYRSLWEAEKALLINQKAECFVPLICDEKLTGFIMLTGKLGKPIARQDELQFLHAISELCAGAVNSAYTYERAVEEAQKDELTGLINFKFFYELLDKEFEKCKDTALSLCLFNLDDFKVFNQMYGTHEGDTALRRVAGIMASSINDSSYAARINGDEFALILPGYDVYSAKCLADNIVEQINEINASFTGDNSGRLTVSAGICAAPYMASSAKELYRNADATVYSVKRTGKNAVQMYSADIYRREPNNQLYRSGYSEHASTIYALTAAIDAKDHYTFQHSQNVAYYASELAKAAGMSSDLIHIVREAGLLHDIGKIGVREDILNKPQKLTVDEYELMKSHVENAVNIIKHLPMLDYVIPAVYSHHERYDGKGYPRRLAEKNIPITGRILCIADSFDAITSVRNYKPALPISEAIAILRSESGGQFDPQLVDIFVDLVEGGMLEIRSTGAESLSANSAAESPAENVEA